MLSLPLTTRSLLLGLCLAFVLFLQGQKADAQTATTQDALWAWDGATLSVCADPTSANSLQTCFSGFSKTTTSCEECSLWPIATDGVNVYLAIEYTHTAYSCPIGEYGQGCTTINVGPSTDGSTVTIAVENGYFWTGTSNNNIWRCAASDGTCEQFDAAGNRPIYAMVVSGDYLYVALGKGSTSNGLIWRCSLTNINSCDNFDNPGSTDVKTLAVGNGYLWAGLGNGIVWQCSVADANSCKTWDTAGTPINFISYDAAGTLFIAGEGMNSTKGNPGVLWSCPTGTSNACTTLITASAMWFTASNAGIVFSNGAATSTDSQSSFWYQTTKFTNPGVQFNYGIPLLYIPTGGVVTTATATLSVSNTGAAASSTTAIASAAASGLAKRCKKTGREWARLRVSGPYGMDLKRRINLCQALEASTSTIKLTALDAGSYYVTLESGRYTGKVAFIVGNGEEKDVSITMKRRWRR